MCYTSGTTGDPKGVLYSHRSVVLHAMAGVMAESARRAISSASFLPIVPMFHVNAWGYPYSAPMIGGKLVFAGPANDPESLYELLENEAVQTAAAVPVIWLRLLSYLEETGRELTALRALRVGGSAAPAAMIDAYEARGVEVIHGWGMTETSPICTVGSIKAKHRDPAIRLKYQRRAGRIVYGVQMRIVDEEGVVQPDDGRSEGELHVRGPWVAGAYYDNPAATAAQFTADGWFRTGDIATLDADGYLTIRDRSKDLIKSGGEWISSIDLENAAIGHPEIAEAAAIAVPHPDVGGAAAAGRGAHPRQHARPRRGAGVPRATRSRSGGCRTTWPSSTSYRTRQPARSRSASCASSSPQSRCQAEISLLLTQGPTKTLTHDIRLR